MELLSKINKEYSSISIDRLCIERIAIEISSIEEFNSIVDILVESYSDRIIVARDMRIDNHKLYNRVVNSIDGRICIHIGKAEYSRNKRRVYCASYSYYSKHRYNIVKYRDISIV